MNQSDKAKLAQLSAFVLERRAAVIRAGGADPAVDEVAAVVELHYDGDLDVATKSLLEELTKRVQAAKDASRAAREGLQQAWNSPAIKEMWARRGALLVEAERCANRAKAITAERVAKIVTLKAQGLSESEVASVLSLSESAGEGSEGLELRRAELLAEADAVRAEIERHAATALTEGSAA